MTRRQMAFLIVEDEPSNREIAEIILQSLGHEVVTCANGQEALDLCFAPGRHFDAVLMDILLPVLDGLAATQTLRARADTMNIPIICMSAKVSGSDLKAGMSAGCDCYLKKPYKRKDLLRTIEDTLRARGALALDDTIA